MVTTNAFTERSLRDDLVVFPHREEEVAACGIPANCYVLKVGSKLVLVDAVFQDVLPGLRALLADGTEPAAMVLSHRHVVAQAEILPELIEEFKIPVLLNPIDAAHPQASRWRRLSYQDPAKSSVLAVLGIRVLFIPGHTEGHIMLYRSEAGGLLLTGDCAVGPTAGQAEKDDWPLLRPPLSFNTNDDELRRGWEKFSLPVSTLGPYHGMPLVDMPNQIDAGIHSMARANSNNRLPGE